METHIPVHPVVKALFSSGAEMERDPISRMYSVWNTRWCTKSRN